MAKRSKCLVPLGWFVALALYIIQACVLMKFLVKHTATNGHLYWIGVGIYLLFALIVFITLCCTKGYAQYRDEIWNVWFLWFVYIIIYIISVGLIFGRVVHKLDKSETFGPNCLKITLCIAPALLVLVLQLVISPSYREGFLALSVFAALDLFDGIEMLEIVLMQNEWEDFNLNDSVEKCIIVFACVSFFFTSLGLTVNKFDGFDAVEEKRNPVAVGMTLLVILFTNVSFLVLRVYIWVDSGYEASIFIAKNIVSLVVGFVDFFITCKCFTCE